MRLSQEQYDALIRIMELHMVVVELQLYLDTHPYDTTALNLYNEAAMEYHMAMMEYQNKYAMLMSHHPDLLDPYKWNWIDSPWPWEIDYC